ncbi:MAG: lipoprotein [Patescibacteria group bacterium]|nr:lipoprotein [Patescibacteria group bacterium]MDD4303913.1 lipoprotein [Patescibacteria group bacterium]MDD4695100.1 lipoprotein [Patescibacteria group bacterium]
MKKIIILLVIIFLLSGCTIIDTVSNKFTKKNSIKNTSETKNDKFNNPVKKSDLGSDIFFDKQYQAPLVISREDFDNSCSRAIDTGGKYNWVCNSTMNEKIGCISKIGPHYLNFHSNIDMLDIYRCNSVEDPMGKHTGLTNSSYSFIYLSIGEKRVIVYYDWDDFIKDYKPIIDSKKSARYYLFSAGFTIPPIEEALISKTEDGYLIPGFHYYDNRKCDYSNKSGDYKIYKADFLVDLNGIIKLFGDNKFVGTTECFPKIELN